jgi:thioredoxin:protein disulfide reductase
VLVPSYGNSAKPIFIGVFLTLLEETAVRGSRFWRMPRNIVLLAAIIAQIGLAVASSPSTAEPDLLEPERAFQLSAIHKNPKTVELRYKIADGYYMYRGRFKFEVQSGGTAKLGKATFSKGKMKQDPTFGRVETYRDSVRILLPIMSMARHLASDETRDLRLVVTSQGCADVGVCYPPTRQTLALRPGSLDAVEASAAPVGKSTESISDLLRNSR